MTYDPQEEKLNVITHAFGAVMGVVALILLWNKATASQTEYGPLAGTIFGLSLIILYTASTLYHRATHPIRRLRLKIFDHAAIYVLIAGTYTPFCLITLRGTTGYIILAVVWSIALLGIIFKLFFTGKFDRLSTIAYVLMGWIIVFAAQPLYHNLPTAGLYWLIAGGLSYTLGAVLYSIDKIPFNHAIFHVFVLIGSFCHFYSIYHYVL